MDWEGHAAGNVLVAHFLRLRFACDASACARYINSYCHCHCPIAYIQGTNSELSTYTSPRGPYGN